MPPDLPPSSTPPDPGVPARLKLGTARFESVNAPVAGGPPPVEVVQILRDNLARANAAGLNELAPMPPRRSRRRRDYWLLLVSANLVFGLIAVCSGPSAPLPFVSALSGMALVSGGLTWLMWFVMDDY
jgi:hypothetical protein